MKKILYPFLAFICFTQYSMAAAPGFKTLINNYQYAVNVEWDQRDVAFLKNEEAKLKQGIQVLIDQGMTSEELVQESLMMIPSQQLSVEIKESVELFKAGRLSNEELISVVTEHMDSMGQRGSSWSPVTNILVGVVATYVVLKALMLVIYYWDTDPNYGQTGDPPPVPKS
ncbi:MAG: hypothetical protein K2P81_07760 [Bacteriovoracaceae bacterium]|nr:hypothetical protein [Bacteriovoracaceae bacterium]